MQVRRWTLNFVTITFSIALALLYILVLHSITVQISPPPQPLNEPYPDTSTRQLCEAAGGRWVERPVSQENVPQAVESVPQKPLPVCQGLLRFERERELQQEQSQQTALFVYAIGGALVVAASLLVDALKPIAPGLMLGGIVAFFFAGFQIWVLSPGLGRLATIVIIFLILISVGLYALRREEDKPLSPDINS